ncbi:MAG: cytochrome c3 family protein [Chloroflexota bacterium]|jgi:hypothetical protein
MREHRRLIFLLLGVVLLMFGLILVACSEQEAQTVEVTRIVTEEVTVPGADIEVTRIVEVELPPSVPVIPFAEEWMTSPHNDKEAAAFTHWDEDDPPEVPVACAKCHSTPGHLDFLGADGSEALVVNDPAPVGTTVQCEACHNDVTLTKTSVVFPSGIEIINLGDEARCMECHQGRASTVSVDNRIADAGLTDDVDTVSEDMGFTNIHYYAAAATQYGTLVKGGYEYAGESYDARFDHVASHNTCIECHDMHTLEVRIDECTVCHTDVNAVEDLVNVRMAGSLVDYDGDGDMDEGVHFEIEGLRDMLYTVMQTYAREVAGTPIAYDSASYPYFFIDTNDDGELSEDEIAFPNAFNAWTARLAKAAYNYQVSLKDPGRYAHGGKYVIQLLYDSIDDLNQAVSTPVDLASAHRIDHGHFAGSEAAFRHWDEDGGIVPGTCAKCHTAAGLPQFLTENVNTSLPASNGLDCATCHNDVQEFTIYEVEQVTFPSGLRVSFGEDETESNLCITCHQGRESTVSVNRLIADKDDNTPDEGLRFLNIHYYTAGATLFGTEVKGAYEFAGQEYSGRLQHVPRYDTCTECHSIHALEVEVEACSNCHEGVETEEDLRDIRVSEPDYDGDGDADEGVFYEVDTMRGVLLAAIQEYATNTAGLPIIYSSARYPYWFGDPNGNGQIDEGEGVYTAWTPNLLRAAYNYQDSLKDPGAYAHNTSYILQILYDSINAVGGDTSGMTRAAVVTGDTE